MCVCGRVGAGVLRRNQRMSWSPRMPLCCACAAHTQQVSAGPPARPNGECSWPRRVCLGLRTYRRGGGGGEMPCGTRPAAFGAWRVAACAHTLVGCCCAHGAVPWCIGMGGGQDGVQQHDRAARARAQRAPMCVASKGAPNCRVSGWTTPASRGQRPQRHYVRSRTALPLPASRNPCTHPSSAFPSRPEAEAPPRSLSPACLAAVRRPPPPPPAGHLDATQGRSHTPTRDTRPPGLPLAPHLALAAMWLR